VKNFDLIEIWINFKYRRRSKEQGFRNIKNATLICEVFYANLNLETMMVFIGN
jgi:hypothetical protein